MDNFSRSERTRNAAIQAAITIIVRDGANRLTLDAIAREGGISKGGLMHQFPTKEAVLKALLAHQTEYFDAFFQRYLAEHGAEHAQPHLAARIATSREALTDSHSIAFAILGAVAQEPGLLAGQCDLDAACVAIIKAEAADPDLATLRWLAARGLVMTTLLGLCPLTDADRERLFARLIDDSQWTALSQPAAQDPAPAPRRKPAGKVRRSA